MNGEAPTAAVVIKSPAWLLATWWGTGLSPRAPGTVGSLAALPFCSIWLLYLALWGVAGDALLPMYMGVWAAVQAGAAWGKPGTGCLVIDGVLDQLLAPGRPY